MKRVMLAAAALSLSVPSPAFANGMSQWNRQTIPAWCFAPDESYPNGNYATGRASKWGPCWAWLNN